MLRILLVEDNPADAHILEKALNGTGLPVAITWLSDGRKAAAYLNEDSGQKALKENDLVILDLNLPGVNGFELLELIRAKELLRALPVVMMSGSEVVSDVTTCYRLGANSYIRKYIEIGDIFASASQLVKYWSTCVTLPSVSCSTGLLPQQRKADPQASDNLPAS